MKVRQHLYIFFALFLAACGGISAAENLPTATTIPPTATPVPPTATPVPPTEAPTDVPKPAAGPTVDINAYLEMDLSGGDAELGNTRALIYGCSKCHSGDNPEYAPSFKASDNLPHILERGELRIADPAYSGQATNNMEYILESIFNPVTYIVPGEWEKTMPEFFVARIKDEDLPHLLAWMASLE